MNKRYQIIAEPEILDELNNNIQHFLTQDYLQTIINNISENDLNIEISTVYDNDKLYININASNNLDEETINYILSELILSYQPDDCDFGDITYKLTESVVSDKYKNYTTDQYIEDIQKINNMTDIQTLINTVDINTDSNIQNLSDSLHNTLKLNRYQSIDTLKKALCTIFKNSNQEQQNINEEESNNA